MVEGHRHTTLVHFYSRPPTTNWGHFQSWVFVPSCLHLLTAFSVSARQSFDSYSSRTDHLPKGTILPHHLPQLLTGEPGDQFWGLFFCLHCTDYWFVSTFLLWLFCAALPDSWLWAGLFDVARFLMNKYMGLLIGCFLSTLFSHIYYHWVQSEQMLEGLQQGRWVFSVKG